MNCDQDDGSTDRHHMPSASGCGKARRAGLRSSPRWMRRAAHSLDTIEGLAAAKRSLMPVLTKPGITTHTPTP